MVRRSIAGMLVGCIVGMLAGHAIGQERGAAVGPTVVVHPPLRLVASDAADGISVEGDVARGVLGDTRTEISGNGVRLLSGARRGAAGSVSFTVGGLNATQGRWYRFRIRGLVEEDFHVERDDLYLRVEFFKDGGKDPLDHVKKSFYAQVDRERNDFADRGTNKNLGPATWRNYVLEFRTPFPEVDTLRLSAGFGLGAAKGKWNEFWITEMEIESVPEAAGSVPNAKAKPVKTPKLSELVRLGGRWYYDPQNGPRTPPRQFDHTNADRLFYQGGRLEAPFAGNMTAWVRKGYLERGSTKQNPTLVEQDRFVEDSVIVTFTDQHLVIRSKNLPNHPTAVFPDRWRLLDGNPNYIQEQEFSFFIALEPQENPRHVAMDPENRNQALPGGPIGVMANGVIFHNPFDERVNEDAVWRLDRCCGHPSPIQRYHYHKYPVCMNTPWDDQGEEHSPLLGFAFDGFPLYGPYEGKGVLAKDSRDNPLNDFNVHYDEERGWHYHVTPGKFPHLIGGFWGEPDPRNRFGPGPGGPMPPRPQR